MPPSVGDNQVLDRSQAFDSKGTEMSEWLSALRGGAATARHLAIARAESKRERRRMKEHAWKTNPASDIEWSGGPKTNHQTPGMALLRGRMSTMRTTAIVSAIPARRTKKNEWLHRSQ